ncbi:hypothetical protein EJ110_NYTH01498 [Nymphaea thermarum]|nr:hypothetical protein EJ110_NYTH01498 [Nymphaea thermarum]
METEKHGHHHLFHGEKKLEKAPEQQLKHHKHMQLLGKVGTVTAGAYALHEKNKAKKDPENAHAHKVKEGIAATIAVGSAGLVFHEHHEKKAAKKMIKEEKKKGNGH